MPEIDPLFDHQGKIDISGIPHRDNAELQALLSQLLEIENQIRAIDDIDNNFEKFKNLAKIREDIEKRIRMLLSTLAQ